MELPKRKAIRLPDYEYSSPGAYFITICTHERRCILSRITVGADALGGPCLQLTDTGKVVEQYILSTNRMTGFHVDKYVVMPNHIHMILRIDNGPPRAPPPVRLFWRIIGTAWHWSRRFLLHQFIFQDSGTKPPPLGGNCFKQHLLIRKKKWYN